MSEEKSAPQEFKSDAVVLTMREEPDCRVSWEVEVTPAGVAAAELKALQTVRKRVSIPGFRKGKAPEATIRKQFASAIQEELADAVVNTAFQEAIGLTGYYPYSNESLKRPKLHSLSSEEGAKVEFEFERFPEIPEIDVTKVSVERPEVEPVDEKEIEEQIAKLRESHGKFESVDRPIGDGDYAELTVDRLEGEETSRLLEKERFHITTEAITPWIYKLVMGKSSGETVEGASEVDPEATDEEKEKFEPQQLRISIESVQEQQPPSDEELVAAVKLESMDDLHTKLHERVEAERKSESDRELRGNLWRAIESEFSFAVPHTLVQSEIQQIMRERIERMAQEGLTEDAIREHRAEIEGQAEGEARLRLQVFYLVHALSEREKVKVGDEEVRKHLAPLLFYHQMMQQQAGGEGPDKKALEEHAHYLALQAKVEDLLLERLES